MSSYQGGPFTRCFEGLRPRWWAMGLGPAAPVVTNQPSSADCWCAEGLCGESNRGSFSAPYLPCWTKGPK